MRAVPAVQNGMELHLSPAGFCNISTFVEFFCWRGKNAVVSNEMDGEQQ